MVKRKSAKTKHPELILESDGTDLFLRFEGRLIAKRGQPNTPQAGRWIPLEPGVVIHQDRGTVSVEIKRRDGSLRVASQ
jgi:hypothetical protein